MGFSKISKALEIPPDATAVYTFFRLELVEPGPDGLPRPVQLKCRHAGDGTPAFKRASWHAANAARLRTGGADATISEAKTRARLIDEAKLIADHCVVGWEHVYEDGAAEPSPCTPAKVYEFLCALIDAADGMTEYVAFRSWLQNADTFRPTAGAGDGELGKA